MREASLAQTLAVESQIRLPGSAGRLLKQIRDIESVAPLFRDAGLIKPVNRPAQMNLSLTGIATKYCIKKALGGFIYSSAAVRTDMLIADNKVSTQGSDSVAELDDIDIEAQTKRLELIAIRQSYELIERTLKKEDVPQLIIIDTPLFLEREMAPLSHHLQHVAEYEKTLSVIRKFWEQYRNSLFPWNKNGPVLVSIMAQRFSAIVNIAYQDLRTEEGRKHLLLSDGFKAEKAASLVGIENKLKGIGDYRFIKGILGSFNRTIAFRITEKHSRIEPVEIVSEGLIGFHFKGGNQGEIQMIQMAGEESEWDSIALDNVAWKLMILDMQSHHKSVPLPQILGLQQLKMLEQFTDYYRNTLISEMKKNEVEDIWLSGLFEDE